MPTFMDSLTANPSGSGGIYNSQKPPDQANELAIVNQLKDREMRDFKDKAGFMADLSLKQERLRAMYDPTALHQQDAQNPNQQQGPQVSQVRDPNAMNANQKGELDIKQQGLNLDKQKLDQQKQLGQEAQDTKSAQEKLNQQKSDQIHAQKIAELEAKQAESKNKLDLAHQALTDKNTNLQNQLELHDTIAKNTKAYHDAEMSKKDLVFAQSQKAHQDLMDAMQKKLDAANKTTTTTLNPDGTSKTVKTTTGSDAGTVQVKGKDGKTYEIPANKQDEWNQQHAPDKTPPAALAGPQAGQDSSDDEENDSSENGR